jgi:hypothetical protein
MLPEPKCFVEQLRFRPRRLCEQQVNGRAVGHGLVKSVPDVVRVGPLYLKNPQASTAAARTRENIDMSSAFPERRRDSCTDGHWKLKRQSPEGIEDRLMLRKRALLVRGPALHHCLQKVCFDYRLTIGETLNTEVANFLSSGRQILTDSSVAPIETRFWDLPTRREMTRVCGSEDSLSPARRPDVQEEEFAAFDAADADGENRWPRRCLRGISVEAGGRARSDPFGNGYK